MARHRRVLGARTHAGVDEPRCRYEHCRGRAHCRGRHRSQSRRSEEVRLVRFPGPLPGRSQTSRSDHWRGVQMSRTGFPAGLDRPGGLSYSQRAAVERWGQDVCVVAGPGSGKTRVLIERFRWLVEVKGISPRRILAVTFTEKAATEIKKRLIETFSESDERREEIERAWVSTIHGFCTRLLKENAIAAGIDPEFRLIDEAESQISLRRFADAALDGLLEEQPEHMRTLLYELDCGGADIADGIIELYEELRSAGESRTGLRPVRQAGGLSHSLGWDSITAAMRVLLTDPPTGNYKQCDAHRKLHQWAREILTIPPDAPWSERVRLFDRM